MPAIEVNGEYGTFWYWESDSLRNVLSQSQMEDNALYFYGKGTALGWTLEAIAGMLGNIRWEGAMNPAQWQYGSGYNPESGYGLVQWTPSTKYTNWCAEMGYNRLYMQPAIERIQFEADNGLQWITTSKYPMEMSEFLKSTNAPSDLAEVWLYNYERPKYPEQTKQLRRDTADTWYTFLSGKEPPTPGPDPDPPGPGPDPPPEITKKRMPIYMYPAFRK